MAKAKKTKIDVGDVDLAKQKIKVGELLAQDRHKLLMKMPFIGALLMRLDLVPVRDERLNTAATDGDRIYVDIDFYMKLKSDERLFVLAHEAWHCALIHFMRRGDRIKELFNIAADLEIHFILTDEGLKAPFVLPHDPRWKGLSAEEIYERIQKKAQQQKMADGGGGFGGMPDSGMSEGKESENIKGQGNGQGFDKHLERDVINGDTDMQSGKENSGEDSGAADGGGADEENDGDGGAGSWKQGGDSATEAKGAQKGHEGKGRDADYSPEVKPGAEERCRERLTAAVQQYERTRGSLPAGLAGLVEAILKPEIGWKELLSQFVTNCYGGSRRWLPPARRHVWKGLYLQSQRMERLRAIVAIDTSGSTGGDLPKFFSELVALLNSFGSYELTVIQCDAAVGKVETFDDCNLLDPDREWEVTGGGGTDFRPVFSYIDEHSELDPNLLIFFTDGLGTYPKRPPPYPVMWLLTSDGQCGVDWGQQVKFKQGE